MCLSHPLLCFSPSLVWFFSFLVVVVLGGFMAVSSSLCSDLLERESQAVFPRWCAHIINSLLTGRKPENSKSVSSKLCAGVEKSIRCLSMPRIWMGERERKTHCERKRERERPPNTRAISCYGSHCNQIQLLRTAIFINNLCYFISGMSHNVFFNLCEWGGGWRLVDG